MPEKMRTGRTPYRWAAAGHPAADRESGSAAPASPREPGGRWRARRPPERQLPLKPAWGANGRVTCNRDETCYAPGAAFLIPLGQTINPARANDYRHLAVIGRTSTTAAGG